MNRTAIQSSALQSAGYDVAARTLELQFASGTTYRYFDVPEFLFRALLHATSKGHFFQTSIEGRFKYEQVK